MCLSWIGSWFVTLIGFLFFVFCCVVSLGWFGILGCLLLLRVLNGAFRLMFCSILVVCLFRGFFLCRCCCWMLWSSVVGCSGLVVLDVCC